MKVASSISLSWDEGVRIDGIQFPFEVLDDVTIEHGGGHSLTIVSLPIPVWGVVTLDARDGKRRVIDSELGDVGEWARSLVRAGLLEAFPWLTLPPVDGGA